MSIYLYPRYSTSMAPRYRHHYRQPYHTVYTSPNEVQDALDLVSALVSGLATSEATAPQNRFITNDNGQFKFALDIQDYKPEELKIDVEGRHLIVSGTHKSEDEHGILEKQFTRRFTVPDSVDLESIKCDFDEKNRALEISGNKLVIKESEKKSIKIGMKPKEVEAKNDDNKPQEK